MEKHLNGYCHKTLMERLNHYGTVTDFAYRLRQARCLLDQIRTDYGEFNRLRYTQVGHESSNKEEELVKLLSWLKEELGALRELEGREIENVIWPRIGQIENDIKAFGPRNSTFWANTRSIFELL